MSTTTNPTTAADAAAEALLGFYANHWEDGSFSWHYNTDAAPAWAYEAIRDAHGDRLPADSIFALCRAAFDWLADSDYAGHDDAYEFADNLYQVQTYAAAAEWLAEHPDNQAWTDDASAEFGVQPGRVMAAISAGQFAQAVHVFDIVLQACIDAAEGGAA